MPFETPTFYYFFVPSKFSFIIGRTFFACTFEPADNGRPPRRDTLLTYLLINPPRFAADPRVPQFAAMLSSQLSCFEGGVVVGGPLRDETL